MEIKDFTKEDIKNAYNIIAENYELERKTVFALPEVKNFPVLDEFAQNGLGVAAYENDKMLGFLCCYCPWDNAFDTSAKGTFSPIHAHGAVKENELKIYRKMYQSAAEKWVSNGITYHAISLYAHDNEAKEALFGYGFGMRCIDAIRPAELINCKPCDDISFKLITGDEVSLIKDMARKLAEHLGESPCFMYSDDDDFNSWFERVQHRNSLFFTAFNGNSPIGYIEVTDDGENFATEDKKMKNICGAYITEDYRGSGVFPCLLNSVIEYISKLGFTRLGVDYESFNPTANSGWGKYFTPYTNSVIRRIDEGVLRKYNK